MKTNCTKFIFRHIWYFVIPYFRYYYNAHSSLPWRVSPWSDYNANTKNVGCSHELFFIWIPPIKMARNATSADAISKFAMVEEMISGYFIGCSTYSFVLFCPDFKFPSWGKKFLYLQGNILGISKMQSNITLFLRSSFFLSFDKNLTEQEVQ